MSNGFILRFDDLCPTLNWSIWNPIEEFLVELGLKPILAVIPDNRDKGLVHGPPGENFWDRVQSWQKRGWTIGLHGYQHCYLTQDPGMYGRVGRSEFAGLPSEVQEIKLRNAIRIFHQHGVNPRCGSPQGTPSTRPPSRFLSNSACALSMTVTLFFPTKTRKA